MPPPRRGGSLWNYVRLGAKLGAVECVVAHALPAAMLASPTFADFVVTNAVAQLCLFLPVVQLPALLTGHMAYVDIGWPCGLVLLAVNALRLGTGWWLRRWVVCGCLLLHGLRMALGALKMFYPYRWDQDLPRYRYARVRWGMEGMPAGTWWLKAQHDTLQQAFANSVVLAAPIMLCAFDPTPHVHPVEVAGWALWGLSWAWENAADVQKIRFLGACKRAGASAGPAEKAELKAAVLGHAPFDGAEYRLWTLCRHPNYFGEWMCWNAFTLAAVPSLLALSDGPAVTAGFAAGLYFCPRFFYDCLMYWTGAEPAEHFSVQKRPRYREYQTGVRAFFPFDIPWVDHHKVPGWPGTYVD